ncbi:MAG TPA: secondary thiamine-phosphate synthase enzyme YjbQ [Polyangia bacterium]|jgi:secondary thiamine-phosphate synthase enzyme
MSTVTSHLEELSVRTARREELIDITSLVRAAVRRTGVEHGVVYVYCPHTTAGITIQENADPDVRTDLLAHLARVVPQEAGFRHGEGNADAHIKSTLTGSSQVVPLDGGKLCLGTWQALFFCEYDGPRSRRVLVKVIAG